jgi:hypothetical protein
MPRLIGVRIQCATASNGSNEGIQLIALDHGAAVPG